MSSTNLELVGHFEKKQQQKRREFIDIPLASVTYGKYAILYYWHCQKNGKFYSLSSDYNSKFNDYNEHN